MAPDVTLTVYAHCNACKQSRVSIVLECMDRMNAGSWRVSEQMMPLLDFLRLGGSGLICDECRDKAGKRARREARKFGLLDDEGEA